MKLPEPTRRSRRDDRTLIPDGDLSVLGRDRGFSEKLSDRKVKRQRSGKQQSNCIDGTTDLPRNARMLANPGRDGVSGDPVVTDSVPRSTGCG